MAEQKKASSSHVDPLTIKKLYGIWNIYKDNLGQEVNNLQVEFEDEALDYLNKYGSMLLDMGLSPAALKAEFSNIKGRVRLWITELYIFLFHFIFLFYSVQFSILI